MTVNFLVFNLQLTASLALLALVVAWYVRPWLASLDPVDALVPPLLVGGVRFMGLVFLVPDVTPGMPPEFGVPTGIGDALSAVLALTAAIACRNRWSAGRPLAWAYLVLGGLDLAAGFAQGFRYGLWDHLGGAWTYICFGAPAVILGLVTLGELLVRPAPSRAPAA